MNTKVTAYFFLYEEWNIVAAISLKSFSFKYLLNFGELLPATPQAIMHLPPYY